MVSPDQIHTSQRVKLELALLQDVSIVDRFMQYAYSSVSIDTLKSIERFRG